MEDLELMETQVMNADFWQLLIRFLFNTLVVTSIIGTLYYPRAKRRDYSFTFMLISISIFMMIFLLGSVKVKIGFALGLFAIFGIIRYRTEQMPVREMTYLFVIISISVINALSATFSWLELVATNFLFYAGILIAESSKWLKHVSTKTIKYDRIELIVPERREELLQDLITRTGLNIVKIEIGDLDFLKDMAIIRISYEPENNDINTTDGAIIK